MTPSEISTRLHSDVPTALAAPGGTDTGISALLVPLVVVLLVGGLAILAYTRRKRRAETRTTPAGSAQQQGWADDGVLSSLVPLSQLDVESRQLLADTDEAIRTHTEELAVVAAQFGQEAAQPFTEALTDAGNRLSAALRIRRRLDDAPPEDDVIRRRMLGEIIALCTEADRRLAAESLHREGDRDVDRP